jgi:hypothetical protein
MTEVARNGPEFENSSGVGVGGNGTGFLAALMSACLPDSLFDPEDKGSFSETSVNF